MMSITLRDLGNASNPLMMQGKFSVFNDGNVVHTTAVNCTVDVDGVCLISRYMYILLEYSVRYCCT